MSRSKPEPADDADTAPIVLPRTDEWAAALDAVALIADAAATLETELWDLPTRPDPLMHNPVRVISLERYLGIVRLLRAVRTRIDEARVQLEPIPRR